jgi:hypothetical protein
MTVVGWLASVVLAIVIVAAIGFAVLSLPDLNRYRRLRKM